MKPKMVIETQVESEVVRNLKSMAIATIETLAVLKEKKKNAKEMLDAELFNSEGYLLAHQDLEKTKKELDKEKSKVMLLEPAIDAEKRYKDISEEVKGAAEALSAYLSEIYRQTGQKELADGSGKIWKMKHKFSVSPGQTKMF